MGLTLQILRGGRTGETIRLDSGKKLVVGRDDGCDLCLLDAKLELQQFRIETWDDQSQIVDTSECGTTLLNRTPVVNASLTPGDLIEAGNSLFVVMEEAGTPEIGDLALQETEPTYLEQRKVDPSELRMDRVVAITGEEPSTRAVSVLNTLNQLGYQIHAEQELEQMFRLVLEAILGVVPAERGAVVLDRGDGEFEMAAYYSKREAPLSRMPISRTIVAQSIERGLSSISSDAKSDRRFKSYESVEMHQIRSVMCVPLVGREHNLGAIYIDNPLSADVFAAGDLELVSVIGQQAGIAFDRTRLEQELRQREERYRDLVFDLAEQKGRLEAILSSTSDGMLLLDHGGRLSFVNRSLERMLELEPGALDGIEIEALADVLRERRPTPRDAFDQLLGIGSFGHQPLLSLRCEIAKPGMHTLLLSATPVIHEGEELGRLAVIRDVTAEEQARRTKDDLVANVSHELRTPLTSIRGFVDLLRNDRVGPMENQQKEFLDIVAENVMRLSELVSDLLDVDRVEKIPLAAMPVELVSLFEDVLQVAEAQARHKNLELSLYAPGPMEVIGDRERLHQVFVNLVVNAVRYTRRGEVRVIVRPPVDGLVPCEIRDTGVGIAPDELPHLFERFFRSSNKYVVDAGGTGLGLNIVRKLVERMHGRIEVESKVDKGSVFRVWLPAAGEAEA